VADVLGVSRTPVREALGLLAQRGMLERRDRGGFVVVQPSRESLQQKFELRRLLEPYAARKAAALMTPVQVERLHKEVAKLRKLVASGTAADVARTNREVRRLLFQNCGNPDLLRAIEQVTEHVYFLGTLTMEKKSVRELVLACHQRILRAIDARDEDAVEKALVEYLDAAYGTASEWLDHTAG
jgi:DNA-binding GntR family transcriptional regulator